MDSLDLHIFLPKHFDLNASTETRGTLVRNADNLIYVHVGDGQIHHPRGEECTVSVNASTDTPFKNNHLKLAAKRGRKSYINATELILNRTQVDLNKLKNGYVTFYDRSTCTDSENGPFGKYTLDDANKTEENEPKFDLKPSETSGFLKKSLLRSNVFSHTLDTLQCLLWGCSSVHRSKKVSVRVGNLFGGLLFDVLIGIYIFYAIDKMRPSIAFATFEFTETVFPNLRKLFEWLMGSPAGLKLNHAFNTMLGTFFLYHIELWRMFLDIIGNTLGSAIQIFKYLGLAGVTFQAAFLADLLSLASLHIYSIYVYAARLYDLQINGLLALWKLFLGRKRNPLRSVVDSCQYNHHQLFIGTLGFTVLLFLLPTTVLYYVVFTAFRLVQLSIGGALAWFRFVVRSSPFYLVALWTIKSPKIANDIKISLNRSFGSGSGLIALDLELRMPPLVRLVKLYKPDPVLAPVGTDFSELVSSLMWGKVVNS